jgi:hypothetical protein
MQKLKFSKLCRVNTETVENVITYALTLSAGLSMQMLEFSFRGGLKKKLETMESERNGASEF